MCNGISHAAARARDRQRPKRGRETERGRGPRRLAVKTNELKLVTGPGDEVVLRVGAEADSTDFTHLLNLLFAAELGNFHASRRVQVGSWQIRQSLFLRLLFPLGNFSDRRTQHCLRSCSEFEVPFL